MLAWLRNPPAPVLDALAAVIIGVPTATASVASGAGQGRTGWGILFGLAVTLPLLVRRRWPLGVLALIVAAALIAPVDIPFQLPLLLALYTIGAHRTWEVTVAAGAAVSVLSAIYAIAGGHQFAGGEAIGIGLICALGAWVGLYVGGKRSSISSLRAETARLDRERELLAQRAVAEERVRIAQELHDVVAHNISLIVVQAQALGATEGSPRVTAATDGIAELGRRTMAEMHRTLRLLRARDGAPDLTPQPGLDDLEALLERSRAAGLPVELAVEGAPRALAQSVDLSAFRIVQEALTNVFKHADRARTAVTVAYGPDALQLTIVDSGGGVPAPPHDGPGHGLIGMRERAALFGGTLSAGPRAGDGFEVRASLPYDEALG